MAEGAFQVPSSCPTEDYENVETSHHLARPRRKLLVLQLGAGVEFRPDETDEIGWIAGEHLEIALGWTSCQSRWVPGKSDVGR